MITVCIDTREQRPWAFQEALFTPVRRTLKTGDYCLEGDDHFGIERKSLDDFLGTISSGWDRFLREIVRMEKANWIAKVIIVEGQYADFVFGPDAEPPPHRHYQLTPAFVRKRIAQLSLRNVSVLFARDAGLAVGLAEAIFLERNANLKR
jgi:ERCC4-type nuclease